MTSELTSPTAADDAEVVAAARLGVRLQLASLLSFAIGFVLVLVFSSGAQSAQAEAADARGISIDDLPAQVMHGILQAHPTPVWLAVLFAGFSVGATVLFVAGVRTTARVAGDPNHPVALAAQAIPALGVVSFPVLVAMEVDLGRAEPSAWVLAHYRDLYLPLVNGYVAVLAIGTLLLVVRLWPTGRARRTSIVVLVLSGLLVVASVTAGAPPVVPMLLAAALAVAIRRSATASPPWGLVSVTAMALVACSAPDVEGRAAATPTNAPLSTSTAPEGFPVAAAEAVQEQRWRLPGGPDWLAVDDAGVWVKRDDGMVDRVAPDTGEIDLTIELGGELCQGLGTGLGAVWACAGSDVVRLDPATGGVTATLAVNKTFSQGRLVTAAGQLWVLTGDGSTLTGVDPDTGDPVTTIPLNARGTDLAVGDAGLWVVSSVDGQVLRIDPAGAVALRVTGLDRPTVIAVTDQVWIGAVGGTSRIDPDTGEILASSAIGTGHGGSVAIGPDGVWVRSPRRFLVRLDPDTATPLFGISADVASGGDVVVAFDSVWTTAFDDAALFRVPIASP